MELNESRIQIDDNKADALPDEAIVSSGDEHFIYLEIEKSKGAYYLLSERTKGDAE